MATVTKFANANTVVTTGWTTAENAYADDGAYATCAPAKNTSVVSDYGTAAFTSGDIPDNSIINSVTIEAQYKSSVTNSTGATFGLRINDNGSLHTETTYGMTTTDSTVTRASSTAVTLANLRIANTVKARVTGLRGNSNNGITWSVDYVKLTVDYTAPVNGTATPAGVSTTSSLGTAVGVGPGTGSPAGFSSTTSLGTVTETGDANKSTTGSETVSALGTAVADGGPVDGTATPAGVSATSALGSVASTGDGTATPSGFSTSSGFGGATSAATATIAALGFAGTTTLGSAPGSGDANHALTGFAATSALGLAVAAGDPAPAPEPTTERTAAEWARYFSAPPPHARAAPRGVHAVGSVGHATAQGSAAAAVAGVAFAMVRPRRAPPSVRGHAIVRPRAPSPMRLSIGAAFPSVSIAVRPVRPSPPITLTDEEITALVLLID